MTVHLIRSVRDRQPSSLPTLVGRFRGPQGSVLVPSCGMNGIGGAFSLSVVNPGFSGQRLSPTCAGLALLSYADHGGNADDRVRIPKSIPSARAGPFTTVIQFIPRKNGLVSQTVLPTGDAYGAFTSSHFLGEMNESAESFVVGYDGGNGYLRTGTATPAGGLWDKVITVVISTTHGQEPVVAVNASSVIMNNGQVSYVGQGSNQTSGQFTTGGSGYAEYYNFNGYLTLWGSFPGLLISPREAISVSRNPWQIFEPETIPLFFSTVTAQYARPTSDVSSGTWTASSGSDLFAMLDETAENDADYITTTGASTCEVALGSLSDPASSAGHVVRYRISSTGGGITVRLRQGTTTIATWTHSPAPTSLTTYTQTLSSGEADSITDYSALRLQFEATA